jgi:hypothetical protein
MVTATKQITVKLVFGQSVSSKVGEGPKYKITVLQDGSESVRRVKQLVAEAAGGKLTADDLLISFGPNDRKIGRQYVNDPTVDEDKLTLAQFSVMGWLERFPHWTLSCRLLPGTPPPPGALHSISCSPLSLVFTTSITLHLAPCIASNACTTGALRHCRRGHPASGGDS